MALGSLGWVPFQKSISETVVSLFFTSESLQGNMGKCKSNFLVFKLQEAKADLRHLKMNFIFLFPGDNLSCG